MKHAAYLFLLIYMGISLNQANASIVNDFTDEYKVSNWNQDLDGGMIDTSGAPGSIQIISADDQSGATNTDFTIAAVGSGLVTFDWMFSTPDLPSMDPFGWLLNGVFTQLTDSLARGDQSGSNSFSVQRGDVFGFRVHSTDADFGASMTTVSNFSAPVPVPAAVWLMGSGLIGVFGLRRRNNK